MTDTNEARTIATLAQQAQELTELLPGAIFAVPADDGGQRVIDTDHYAFTPRRANSHRLVSDSESFVKYLVKHGLERTEVYADTPLSSVVAVIDSHGGALEAPGWQSHTVTLKLEHTKSWLAWTKYDGQMFDQAAFAEFIEQRATDVKTPAAGDLMTLASHMSMTIGVEYESAQRLADGQTTLKYKEKVATKGLGTMEVPKELMLALQPYVGGPRQYAYASFRTRLQGSALKIGYVLVRPEEILEGVFADIVTEIRDGRKETTGRPGFDGITAPIFYGRPQ